jgi:monoterpene epsilon-lactone hydrolase
MVLYWFLSALVATAVRRARRGPRRPRWSFAFEASVRMLATVFARARGRTPLEQRAVWSNIGAPLSRLARATRVEQTRVGGVDAVWFTPRDARADARVLIYLHGGSFIYGSPLGSHREMIARLATAAGARVLAVAYRRVPEHTFPAAIDDTLAAYAALLASGVPRVRVLLAGDSAGGNLVAAALLALRDPGEQLPAGGVMLSPWVDLAARGGSLESNSGLDWGTADQFARWAEAYLGGTDPRAALASPAHAELRGLPPLLVEVGGCEMLHDQVAAFAARARDAGVDAELHVHDDMVHNWLAIAPDEPAAQRTLAEVAAFVQRVTGA